MFSRIGNAYKVYRKGGTSLVIQKTQRKLGLKTEIDRARLRISDYLSELYDNTVAHGPFKGMKLSTDTWWGPSLAGGKILGTYERQVLEKIHELSDGTGVFIDLGAADGYFAIGAVKSGMYARTIAYEISERGQAAIARNARLNGVEDLVSIGGEATEAALKETLSTVGNGLMLCDIEGAEFQVLTSEVLESAKHLHLIVELHASYFKSGKQLVAELRDRAAPYFETEILRSADIKIGAFPEIDRFDDNHRLLMFSEGRGNAMEWLLLTPKET